MESHRAPLVLAIAAVAALALVAVLSPASTGGSTDSSTPSSSSSAAASPSSLVRARRAPAGYISGTCSNNPCGANGLCDGSYPGFYGCTCINGFSGATCTTPPPNNCASNPCVRGSCSNDYSGGGTGIYKCNCTGSGYFGTTCNSSKREDLCEGVEGA